MVVAVKPGSSSNGQLPQGLIRPTVGILADGIVRDGRSIGSATAKVTLDEWEDFQCPGCDQFTETIEPTIVSQFVATGQVRVTFHDMIVVGAESIDAASAARCAGDQGKFWDFHAWLYANQNGENQGWFSRDRLAGIAAQVGVDTTKWATCYDGGSNRAPVTAETAQGSALGVTQTPTLLLNGKEMQNVALNQIVPFIQAAVEAAGGSALPSSSPSGAPSAVPPGSPSAGPSAGPSGSTAP